VTSPTGLPPVRLNETERLAVARMCEFPLVEAIFGRRSRRFPLGGHVPAGPLAYRSRHAPIDRMRKSRMRSAGAGGIAGRRRR